MITGLQIDHSNDTNVIGSGDNSDYPSDAPLLIYQNRKLISNSTNEHGKLFFFEKLN